MILNTITGIEGFFRQLFTIAGEMVLLFLSSILELRSVFRRIPALLTQMVEVGWNTLPLAALIGMFIGLVLALQTGYAVKDWALTDTIGIVVGLTMIREMGPVITAVLVTGRVGSAMAAEIGTMAVTDEISALRSMGISPVSYLVMPRMLAMFIMQPILTLYTIIIGIVAGQVISSSYFSVSANLYYKNMYNNLEMIDLTGGLSKTFVFAILISIVSCYMGLQTRGGAAAVGRSTTLSVVISLVMIFISNFFITRFYGLQ